MTLRRSIKPGRKGCSLQRLSTACRAPCKVRTCTLQWQQSLPKTSIIFCARGPTGGKACTASLPPGRSHRALESPARRYLPCGAPWMRALRQPASESAPPEFRGLCLALWIAGRAQLPRRCQTRFLTRILSQGCELYKGMDMIPSLHARSSTACGTPEAGTITRTDMCQTCADRRT